MNSVERMVEYTAYESEAPAIVPERRPLPGWPFQVCFTLLLEASVWCWGSRAIQ